MDKKVYLLKRCSGAYNPEKFPQSIFSDNRLAEEFVAELYRGYFESHRSETVFIGFTTFKDDVLDDHLHELEKARFTSHERYVHPMENLHKSMFKPDTTVNLITVDSQFESCSIEDAIRVVAVYDELRSTKDVNSISAPDLYLAISLDSEMSRFYDIDSFPVNPSSRKKPRPIDTSVEKQGPTGPFSPTTPVDQPSASSSSADEANRPFAMCSPEKKSRIETNEDNCIPASEGQVNSDQ